MSAPSATLISAFRATVRASSNRPALFLPPSPVAGEGPASGEPVESGVRGEPPWHSFTWLELATQARRLAALLNHCGVQPGDRVMQISENRLEWILLDLAVHLVRGVHVAVHAVLSGPQIAWQLRDCEAKLVFVSTAEQAAKLALARNELPAGLRIIAYDAITDSPLDIQTLADSLSEIPDLDQTGEELEAAAIAQTRPDDLATILYTSGTTGEPKGVMLSHANLVSNARGMLAAFPHRADELRLCFLPLSHVYARTCDLYTWIIGGTQLALAESRERIVANCQSLRPTLLNGVPYFFDKVRRYVESLPTPVLTGGLSELLGGRLRLCSSGGAALPRATAEFYRQHGVRLVQGYGLTESSPVISTSHPDTDRMGSVGRPIPGIEVRIAADGEILTRGPHVMLGYWRRPQDTADVIHDGWLHTGDLGRLDEAGYLWITGRKKELIVTAAGKNVAPQAIESLLAEEPLIAQVVVIGEGRNYLTALVVPNPDALRAEIIRWRIHVFSAAQALVHPDVLAIYRQQIDRRLACLSETEQIRQFALLDRALSIEEGELTPTLKIRRRAVEQHFADLIERMYTQ